MRKFGIHNRAQDIGEEGFSRSGVGDPSGAALHGSGAGDAPVSGATASTRFGRANLAIGDTQPVRSRPVAVGSPALAAADVRAVRPEPAQVRFWRTPDRFIDQVWTKARPIEAQLPPAGDMAADLELDRDDYCEHGDSDVELAELPVSQATASEGDGEVEAQAEIDEAGRSAPFAFLSDHAFWEGLGDAQDDARDDAPPAANVPFDRGAVAGAAPLPVRVPVAPAAPSKAVSLRPAAEPVPQSAPVAGWSAPQAYRVNLNFTARPWVAPVQGEEGVVEGARSPAADGEPVSRGVVVSRRARDELASQAPRPGVVSSRIEALPLAQPVAFELPPMSFLAEPPVALEAVPVELLQQNAGLLEGVLEDFNIRGEIDQACPGPVVTLYELEPAPGIKSSRVISLADDIARSMSAISARVAVVQGKNAIGIELPNAKRETVFLRELLASQDFESSKHKLALGLGKTIGGEPVIVDLARMPHLLVAGTTGSGKSVAINTMILSLLYRLKPEQCRLIMVDPKMLELSVYDGIPHLLTPVVTDPKKAVVALKWAVREMEERYKKMSKLSVRNIDGFNARVVEAKAAGEVITRTVQTGFDKHSGEAIYEEEVMDLEPLPYIVVIVDEMADLMMVAGKEIEGTIQRLAQMARAAGIHVVLATQRPSVDVITGTIKANFPTRISFQVTSKIDSRTILGEMGAEQLLGQGDMLYMAGGGRITRVHGPFVSDAEVEKVVAHLKTQGRPQYLDAVTSEEEEGADGEDGAVFDKSGMGQAESDDPYEQAVAVVLRDKKASTSYIQRRLQIGYNRAASIMERMENEGIVGPANHAGKREILGETARPREDDD